MRVSNCSTADLRVKVEEGHPLHEPLSCSVTTPSLKERKRITPPSFSTAGFTYCSRASIILFFVSLVGSVWSICAERNVSTVMVSGLFSLDDTEILFHTFPPDCR